MAVSSNSTALPARKPMGRRTLLRGAVALAPVATFSALPAPALGQSQADVARRIHALAGEMSSLLGDLDEGMWEVRIAPPFRGTPIFSIEPQGIDPQAKLDRSLNSARQALGQMRPGKWRQEVRLDAGVILMVNDESGAQT